jgi:hypothetical protein
VRGEPAELGPVMGDGGGAGVRHGAELLAFAEAVVGEGVVGEGVVGEGVVGEAVADGDLVAARAALLDRIGPDGLVDASAIVAGFDATDRIADATGTQLDDYLENGSVELRAELGIDALASLGE